MALTCNNLAPAILAGRHIGNPAELKVNFEEKNSLIKQKTKAIAESDSLILRDSGTSTTLTRFQARQTVTFNSLRQTVSDRQDNDKV